MGTNPIQFCHIEEAFDQRQLKVLALGVGSRRVLYGPRIRPRIEISDEHAEIELELHNGEVLGALRLSDGSGDKTRFLTVGADHRMLVWNLRGEVVTVLPGHSGRIGGVWELTGRRVVSSGEDDVVVVWDLRTGHAIARIETKLRKADRLFIAPTGDFMCLSERWFKTRIVSIDGTPLAVLRWQFEPITGARRLSLDRWITATKRGMKLWSERGELLQKFLRPFSLDDGYYDLPNSRLLIVDSQHHLDLFSRHGAKVGTRDADEAMARDLRRFLRSRKAAGQAIADRPTFHCFEHRTSVVAEPTIARDELRKLELSAEQRASSRTLWDFFVRPDFQRIRSWRRDELQVAYDARERVEDALHSHRTQAARGRLVRLIALAGLGAALWIAIRSTGGTSVVALLVALAAAVLAVHQHLKATAMVAAAKTLVTLPDEIDQFVLGIKEHRRRILASLPVLKLPAIYGGNEIRREIERTITGELTEAALCACGVAWTELDRKDKHPLVVSDWTLLRLADDPATNQPISDHNLAAFWWTPDGAFVPAVQTLQYVLLGREKADIFRVDYDFIAGRAYNQAAYTFYYGDVVDVTSRDLSRPVSIAAVSTRVDATEIAFVLRSGKRIGLIALHDRSTAALRAAAHAATGGRLAELRRTLEGEVERWRRDFDHSDEDRSIELASLRAQLAALDAESLATDLPDPSRRRAAEGVAAIRRRVLERKATPAPRVVFKTKAIEQAKA